jgi:D-cysteine desulfhydrase
VLASGLAGALGLSFAGAAYALARINAIQRFPAERLEVMRDGRVPLLFDRYPALADRIPWRPLGNYPTPIEEIPRLAEGGAARLFVKRDDLSSPLYGGNKVRKLEFFLAEAELASRHTLITLGGIGSNHALAVATHGAALGFDVDLALYDQPLTGHVRANLGGFVSAGARLHYVGSTPRAFLLSGWLEARRAAGRHAPYFIMVGGTSRLGCLGHVNAGLELARQVAEGALPEPDRLFVPLGTCGTAAGLIVGLKLAGLRTRLSAVRVADPFPANPLVLRLIAQDTADFLSAADSAFPRLRISSRDFDFLPDYFGPGYGHPTPESDAAVAGAAPDLALETTYTGKALAACLAACRSAPAGSTLLFWNTFNSAPLQSPGRLDSLPRALANRLAHNATEAEADEIHREIRSSRRRS